MRTEFRPLFAAFERPAVWKWCVKPGEAAGSRVRFRCDDVVDCNRIISHMRVSARIVKITYRVSTFMRLQCPSQRTWAMNKSIYVTYAHKSPFINNLIQVGLFACPGTAACVPSEWKKIIYREREREWKKKLSVIRRRLDDSLHFTFVQLSLCNLNVRKIAHEFTSPFTF